MSALNRVGLYTGEDVRQLVKLAVNDFFVFNDLSADTMAEQLASFDAGTQKVQEIKLAELASVDDIRRKIAELEALIEGTENHLLQVDAVLAKRARVRKTVADAAASVSDYTIDAYTA